MMGLFLEEQWNENQGGMQDVSPSLEVSGATWKPKAQITWDGNFLGLNLKF